MKKFSREFLNCNICNTKKHIRTVKGNKEIQDCLDKIFLNRINTKDHKENKQILNDKLKLISEQNDDGISTIGEWKKSFYMGSEDA